MFFYAALKPNRQLASSEVSKVDASLTTLAEQFEMEVVYPETKPRNRVWEKALGYMRRAAKKVVSDDMKQRRKKVKPHAITMPELRKYRGFCAEEVEIEADADEDRIEDVLKMIGREDEFESIRKAAYREYELDAPFEAPAWTDSVADKPPPAAALAEDMEEIREKLDASKSRKTLEYVKARLADVK